MESWFIEILMLLRRKLVLHLQVEHWSSSARISVACRLTLWMLMT